MKKLFRTVVLTTLLVAVAWNSVFAKNDKPKPQPPAKVEIVHSGHNGAAKNSHEIKVSCRARGHQDELGESYCGNTKDKETNAQPPQVQPKPPQPQPASEEHSKESVLTQPETQQMLKGGGGGGAVRHLMY